MLIHIPWIYGGMQTNQKFGTLKNVEGAYLSLIWNNTEHFVINLDRYSMSITKIIT